MPTKTKPSATVLDEAPEDAPLEDGARPIAELIPIADLRPNVRNVRRQLGDLAELTRSIKAQGVLQPLVVAPHPSEAYAYVIIAGHRRHAAAQAAKVSALPCVVRRDLTSDADVIVAMLTENLQRTDLTAIEEGTAYEQLELTGMKVTQISKATGRSADTIRARKHLMTLPEATRDRIQARQITLNDAEALAEFTDEPATIARLEAELDRGKAGDFRFQLASARDRRERAARRAKAEDGLRAAGFLVVPSIRWQHGVQRLLGVAATVDDGNREVYNPAAVEAHAATGCTRTLEATVTQGAYIDLGCPDPMHRPADDEQLDIGEGGPSAERSAAAQAEARERAEQAKADHRAAARLRREYVAELLSGYRQYTPEMATAVSRHVAALLLDDEALPVPDGELLARLLGDEDLAEAWVKQAQTRDWQAEQQLRETTRDMLLRQLPDQRALLAGVAAAWEDGAVEPYAWVPTNLTRNDGLRSWLRLLGGPLGYEWSPVEEAALAAADAYAAEQQHVDEPEDEGRPVEDVATGDVL